MDPKWDWGWMLNFLKLSGGMCNSWKLCVGELSRSLLKKCELEVQEIIHLKNVANNLPDIFVDPLF